MRVLSPYLLRKAGMIMKHWKRNLALSVGALSAFLYWQDNGLTVSQIALASDKIERKKYIHILHISDLQSKSFGRGQKYILKKIEKEQPDLIVITGDLIDRNHLDMEASLDLIRGIVPLAPVYFVTGNHEFQSGVWDILEEELLANGVTILDNAVSMTEINGVPLALVGLRDKSHNPEYAHVLDTLKKGIFDDRFTILLSHRPELFPVYAQKDFDLVFAGHAHGGQFRLPILGPIFAPHQGFFPEYSEGVHAALDTTMVISRGLGNSSFPVRLFNRPELVSIHLYGKGKKE